jgi:hypothetical protein
MCRGVVGIVRSSNTQPSSHDLTLKPNLRCLGSRLLSTSEGLRQSVNCLITIWKNVPCFTNLNTPGKNGDDDLSVADFNKIIHGQRVLFIQCDLGSKFADN